MGVLYLFMDTIERVKYVTYQRNGVTGEGFYVVRFVCRENGRELLGTVFHETKYVAVVNPEDLNDHYRGDHFENELRLAVQDFEAARAYPDGPWYTEENLCSLLRPEVRS